jgi:photosystem I subunit 11
MTKDFVKPAGDPQIGNLATPINSSELTKFFINNLPIYRPGLDPQRRGLEIGMAHGYLLFGPFAALGPLRDSNVPNLAGFLAASGLIVILTACLWIYKQVGIKKPLGSITTPDVPDELNSAAGWENLARGFLIGGLGGAFTGFVVSMLVSLVF